MGPPSLQPKQMFFCVTTKLFGIKNAPRNLNQNITKQQWMILLYFLKKLEHLQYFAEFMNKQHSNIIFSVEAEQNSALPFLDVKIYRAHEKKLPVRKDGNFQQCVHKFYQSFTNFVFVQIRIFQSFSFKLKILLENAYLQKLQKNVFLNFQIGYLMISQKFQQFQQFQDGTQKCSSLFRKYV